MQTTTLTGSNLGRLLRQTREELWRRMSAELAKEGVELTFSQYIVLKHLRHGAAMSSTLAEHAAINAGAMTRVIDKLVEQGIVVRNASPTDRRALQVELSTEGMRFCKRIEVCGDRTIKQAFNGISQNKINELERTLEHIIGNLDSAKADNG